VADGLLGGVTSVGVGTGGSVSVGSGVSVVVELAAGAGDEGAAAAPALPLLLSGPDGVVDGRAGCDP
jgi:hypothetical protein